MRCRAARRLRKLLGRRGSFLLILGTGKTAWGVSFLVDPPSGSALAFLNDWAWIWIAAGVVTSTSAFLKVGRDGWGFIAALVPPAVWAIAYLAAAISGEYSRGAWVAAWYLTSHVGVILWASTVPEYEVPSAPRKARRAEGG